MRITYDPEVDAMYIRFHETTVTTKHLGEGIAADFDAEGHLAGIEILDILKRLGRKDIFNQVILEREYLSVGLCYSRKNEKWSLPAALPC